MATATMISAMSAKKDSYVAPQEFLPTIGEGRRIVTFAKKKIIYAQGASCDAVFYLRQGTVRLSVVSASGKEATLRIFSAGDFFGEGALARQTSHLASATAMTDCELLRIDKNAMQLALSNDRAFSDMFVSNLLARNIRYQEDLVDQLFNSSEKRLARTLLLLAPSNTNGTAKAVIPHISQEILAEMVGTTRSRVSFFMNRFRKQGFVNYGGSGLQINSSLQTFVAYAQ